MQNNEGGEHLNVAWMEETSKFMTKAQNELNARDRLIAAFWTGNANGDENGSATMQEIIMAQWGRKRLEQLKSVDC